MLREKGLLGRAALAAIWQQSFVAQDSPDFAVVVVARIIAATDRLARLPESGRIVPELGIAEIREVIHRPYRIVYRLVGADQLHVLPVHHSARRFPGVAMSHQPAAEAGRGSVLRSTGAIDADGDLGQGAILATCPSADSRGEAAVVCNTLVSGNPGAVQS